MVTTADRYRWHAEMEFRGVSDTYLDWAIGVSGDNEVLAIVDRLPEVKRRAPLLFAAMRFHGACLFPDRYGYEYVTPAGETRWLAPSDDTSAIRLRCVINSPEFIPTRLPKVTWRAGIDVNPLSFADADDVEWLRTLVWPEHTQRRRRIDQVASMIRANPPRINRGDATELLPQLAAEAPAGTTLVVFHTAVLAYFPQDARDRFEEAVSALDCIWLSNEGPGSLPSVRARVDRRIGIGSRFVLAKDGIPIALTGGHGQSYDGLTQHT